MYTDPYYDDPYAQPFAPAAAAPQPPGYNTPGGYPVARKPDGTYYQPGEQNPEGQTWDGTRWITPYGQPLNSFGVRPPGESGLDASAGPVNGYGGTTSTGTGAPAVDPSYLAPFDKQFDLSSLGTMTGASPGQANIPDFGGFAPNQPQFGGFSDFHQPTAADITQDPSYQFRRDQAIQGVTNSKAAQGLFNSGGTLYDIGNLAGNMASQEYGNIWNRDYNVWNQDNANRLKDFGAQSDAWNQDNLNRVTGFGLKQGTSNEAYQRAVGQYNSMRDLFFANQTNPWNKLAQAASIGANTAAIAG